MQFRVSFIATEGKQLVPVGEGAEKKTVLAHR